ncbi:hypothetical protein SNE40_009042 [Patella caerulea]|uniref:Cathepsin F n=1 Tax=Patella caerulea TaxID=87958 RepID=A0AAN8JN41_PATCE
MKLLVLFGLLPVVFCAGGLMGGKSNIPNPEKNVEIMAATNFALEKLNGLLDSDAKMTNVKIVSAQTQVVSGVNYFLTIRVQYGADVKECNVVVYVQSWTNTNKMTSQNCIDLKASKRSLLGGIVPVDMDADTKKAISFGIENFNQRSNSMFRSQPLKISNVSKQLVAGNLYRFDADMQETQCRKSQDNINKGFADCPPNVKGLRNVCKFTVLQQAWKTPEWTLTDFKCNQGGLLGGDGHDLCHLDHFTKFKTDFNKNYETTQEEKKRFKVFCDNMEIARRIQDVEKGTAKYGPTIFADMTAEEFGLRLNPKPWNLNIRPDNMLDADIPQGQMPTSFDWRDHGAVTAVKNQGSCGSCWAFSTTGNIEGQWAIKKKTLLSLSEQELVDCDKVDQGCNGGLPSQAYEAIMKLGGLETEKEYGYKGYNEKTCFFNKTEVAAKISGSVKISQNEDEIAAWLAKNGPISIGINAFAMQFYMGGISHPWKIFCNPTKLDHGVLIVGYGVEGSEPYWIIKNSWGPNWGEKGYYRVYRGAGVCGLNTMCTSAVVN